MYPRGGVRTVSVANPTNGYAAGKGISKVVSDDNGNPRDFCRICDRSLVDIDFCDKVCYNKNKTIDIILCF